MKRTFRIPDVPRGGWHTYDVRRQQPIALADLTRTQKRRFLCKNAQTRRDQCEVAPGEAAESQQSTQGDGMQTNIKVDNTVSTGLKVTVLGRGKHVQTHEVPKEEEKMEDNFQEMIVEEHPNPRFGREDKEDEGDDHGLAQTVQFGSLPPVVVNNYILPIVFQWSADGEQVIIDTEAVEGEATVEEETIEDQPIAQLIEELTLEEEDDDEPWSVRMVRKGCRLDLEAEAKRQYRSSQRILKELYEAGHKQVGLLGEDRGR
ncbi:hypothetical protein LINGRAPRIM_LOCUS2462 [Linum grandiflorum]